MAAPLLAVVTRVGRCLFTKSLHSSHTHSVILLAQTGRSTCEYCRSFLSHVMVAKDQLVHKNRGGNLPPVSHFARGGVGNG